MRANKKAKKTFSAGKEVRAIARERVGQVKRIRVIKPKKMWFLVYGRIGGNK
jgi:flagellar biogenesis protein FliO